MERVPETTNEARVAVATGPRFEVGSDQAESKHRISNMGEACDVGACDVIAWQTVFVCCLEAATVNTAHDLFEALLSVLEAPRIARSVLLHFECAGSNATSVRCLARRKLHTGLSQDRDAFRRCRHVCTFGNKNTVIA